MKLDIEIFTCLNKSDFRTLSMIEFGLRSNNLVPAQTLSKFNPDFTHESLQKLSRYKLIYLEGKLFQSYKITSLGYDFLAIKALANRRVAFSVGNQIGVGKESDIFEVAGKRRGILVLKLYRLGRSSFREIKNKREFSLNKTDKSWNYFSRKSATKEFSLMKSLHEYGLPVPYAVDYSRHGLLMRKIKGVQLAKVKNLKEPSLIHKKCIDLLTKMATIGLVHCDFNEFNLILTNKRSIIVIDFPQMISTSHPNANLLFERDTRSIVDFFRRIHNISEPIYGEYKKRHNSTFDEINGVAGSLDIQLPTFKYL